MGEPALTEGMGRCHVMIAKVCGRGYLLFAFGLAAAIVGAGHPAIAQDDVEQKFKLPPPAPRTTAPGPDTKGKKTVRLDELPMAPHFS